MDTDKTLMSGRRFLGRCFLLAFAKANLWFSRARASTAFVAAICAICLFAGEKVGWGWKVNRWFIIIPGGVAVFIFVWHLLKAPYSIYTETVKVGDDKSQKQASESESLRSEIASLKKQLMIANDQTAAAQKAVEQKKAIGNEFGKLHAELVERVHQMEKQGSDAWNRSYQNDIFFGYAKTIDPEAKPILDRIVGFLRLHYTEADVGFFLTMTDLKTTEIMDSYDLGYAKKLRFQLMVDYLNHYKKRLEMLMDRKDILAN